jgi:hypothetical protein
MTTQNPPPNPQAWPAATDDRTDDTHAHRAPTAPASPQVLDHARRLADRALGAALLDDAPSAVGRVHRHTDAGAHAGPDRAPAGRPPPGTLDLSVHRRGAVTELGLAGELDVTTAPRLAEAMTWLRFNGGRARTIVIDTTDLDFISVAGYRALEAVQLRPDGVWDPRVVLVVGPVLSRLEAAISAASTAGARRNDAARRGGSPRTRGPSGHRGPRNRPR